MPWFLWRPCVGIPDLCPPLATWRDIIDGTLSLEDVHQMHAVMDETLHQKEVAKNG